MNEHKYKLEPYKGMNSRHRCPAHNCGKDKTFSLYIEVETGKFIHSSVGRCNREDSCGYHYTPKQYFKDNNFPFDANLSRTFKSKTFLSQPKPISFIPYNIFKESMKGYDKNHFVQFLCNQFGSEIANKLVKSYFIASSKYWNGATVFWQKDTNSKIRTGKIMLYNPNTGKRIKNLNLPVYWVHKALKFPNFNLKQCLFGEHLLNDKTKTIAIVESEKTAVIASVYLPQLIWVAVGSLSNLNAEKCVVLKGRKVVLFPDLNGFDKWNNKANELSDIASFLVSDLLERKATNEERKLGLDLADYLLKFDFRDFIMT